MTLRNRLVCRRGRLDVGSRPRTAFPVPRGQGEDEEGTRARVAVGERAGECGSDGRRGGAGRRGRRGSEG